MSGEVYEVSVEGASDKYTLSELSKEDLTISKKDDAAEKNILFVNKLGEVEYKPTLEVGADKEYNTVDVYKRQGYRCCLGNGISVLSHSHSDFKRTSVAADLLSCLVPCNSEVQSLHNLS